MTDDPAAPESLEDVQDEAADTVEDHDSASIFTKKEILLTLKDRFRAKKPQTQTRLLSAYKDDVSRRDFLKLLGFTMGGAVVASGTGWLMGKKVFSDHTDKTITGMQTGSPDTITASGQTIRVGAGETWSDKLVDMSGGYITVIAKDSNWTIRNIGFDGQDTSGRGNTFFGVADTGNGESLIENVYLGDGASTGNAGSSTGHGTSGIWADPDHNGHINIGAANVQGMSDNGIYGSAPGSNGNGQRGTIHIDNCVGSNCHVAQFRLADGCTCTNSMAWNDDSFPYSGRCFWGWPTMAGNRIEIIGCQFDSGSYNGAIHLGRSKGPTEVYMENTQHDGIQERGNVNIEDGGGNGNDVNLDMEVNAPVTARKAANGEAEGGDFSRSGSNPC